MTGKPGRQKTEKSNKWMMTQGWKDVLFLHWPVPAETLEDIIPNELELDLLDGQAWISLVLFKVEGTRPRFLPPIPFIHSYLELNTRTYVKYKDKAGIYFFSLDASKSLVVSLPRIGNFLPYMKARMHYGASDDIFTFKSIRTQEGQPPETLELTYTADLKNPLQKNARDRWLTERYILWTKPKKHLYRLDIHHPEWVLFPASVQITKNSMASFAAGHIDENVPIAHYCTFRKPIFHPPVLES